MNKKVQKLLKISGPFVNKNIKFLSPNTVFYTLFVIYTCKRFIKL